jgi:hypothetical protein
MNFAQIEYRVTHSGDGFYWQQRVGPDDSDFSAPRGPFASEEEAKRSAQEYFDAARRKLTDNL